MAKIRHDAGKIFEVWYHGALLALDIDDIGQLIKLSPETWARAIGRGKALRRAQAMEKRAIFKKGEVKYVN
ncbi:hypothetical protein [Desulfoscipio gibsoniae]